MRISDWSSDVCSSDLQALLNLPLIAYKQYEKQVEDGFIRAAKFLHMLHIYRIFDLPYQSQIVPLAAILADIGDAWEHEATRAKQIGRASCRERVCQYV